VPYLGWYLPVVPSPGPPVVRGWCPGVFDPLLTGDGWLVRVRCTGGAVAPDGLRLVADLAADGGSGQIELTSRANLQLRGLHERALDATGRALVDAGLAAADPPADGWRAIVASPLAGHDPRALVDTVPLVDELAGRLVAEAGGAPPSRFGVVCDDGGSWPLEHLDADLRLRPVPAGGWFVGLRGRGWLGQVDDPVAVVLAAGRLCAAERQRVDGVVDAHGLPYLLGALGVAPSDRPGRRATTDDRPGERDHPEAGRCSLVAAPFLGRLDATMLRALAGLAERDALAVRVTTARSMAFCGIRRERLDAVRADCEGLGLLTTATDPRARLSACVGSRGCEAARADTWAEAARLARAGTGRVHLSGCEKVCGAPRGVTHLVAVDPGRFEERTVTV
jgi:precorrin-3B synthase